MLRLGLRFTYNAAYDRVGILHVGRHLHDRLISQRGPTKLS